MFRNKRRQMDVLQTYQQALMEKGAVPQQTVRTPTRQPTFVSDYVVPLAHAMTWGLLVATLGIILANKYLDLHESKWIVWLEYFLTVSIVAYLITSGATWRLLWMALENRLGKDLDGSGAIGDRPIIKGRRDRTSDHGVSGKVQPYTAEEDDGDDEEEEEKEVNIVADYPFNKNENTLQWFVRVSSEKRVGTNSRTWEPLLGRKRYQSFRDSLINAGWARWNHYDEHDLPLVTGGWTYDKEPDEILKNIS